MISTTQPAASQAAREMKSKKPTKNLKLVANVDMQRNIINVRQTDEEEKLTGNDADDKVMSFHRWEQHAVAKVSKFKRHTAFSTVKCLYQRRVHKASATIEVGTDQQITIPPCYY